MALTKIHKVLAPIGTPKPGQKRHWVEVGSAFRNEDGQIRIAINVIPTHHWDGWLYFFPPDPVSISESKPKLSAVGKTTLDDLDDDIPF